ncbi:MAG: hypothetical protein UY77_C0003G0008 [Candidatus Uhrbacteria bacterium GW2011_GWA2_53_10]|uniref:Glycosyltransferase 2-like domain-containing protein n=1 Tax=Candidatus Uhrbacteria bacterium GW2011_GWA2_53_10 TaxID=1618980 RepID=A0A0G2AKU1_9BACT|nr:MAG: hypothetical protein UY77_C0003G0008 [Candidatus Uhrbacteria bacterium GW2011_GWA2_53_10]
MLRLSALMSGQPLYEYGRNRFWEIVPGALVWLTFVGAIVLSLTVPIVAIMMVILFYVYWLFRVTYYVVYLTTAWLQYRRTLRVDWQAKCQSLPGTSDIYHLIFLPTYQEELSILRATLKSLRRGGFPTQRLILVLAGEERDHERFSKNAQSILREYGTQFAKVYVTEHPANLLGEIPGKGSNLHWAGEQVALQLAKDFPDLVDEKIVVSSFDIDTIIHPQYFWYLTWLYCTVPEPTRSSYQPVALFSNTIWTAPAPVRIAAFGTTFWLMSELTRPERLWTFSSHSMPWKMLKDVGFWERNIVSEDSRIFLQAFLHYHGQYRVTPMFLPVSMDTVSGRSYWEALKALYRQQRRWAWGVEHLPVMVEHFRRDPLIPWQKKLKYVFNHMEGMFTWATAPILIFILGRLPLDVAAREGSALVQAAPFTLETIMQLAMVGVLVSGIFSLTILPHRPEKMRHTWWLVMILQWLLLPVTFILFGSLPAIDAQTRLMLGKYLGFNVTKKMR